MATINLMIQNIFHRKPDRYDDKAIAYQQVQFVWGLDWSSCFYVLFICLYDEVDC